MEVPENHTRDLSRNKSNYALPRLSAAFHLTAGAEPGPQQA